MATQIKKTESKTALAVNANMTFQKNYMMVPVEKIIADEKKNPRLEYGDIEELMLSIVENGIRNPLKGYEKDGKIILKDGHRRMRAVKLALQKGKKIERVPVILEEKTMSEEERTLEFILYNEGKALTMLEQAEVIQRLLNFGWKVTEIVKKTGKARGYIENLILLTRITVNVKNYIKEGKISAHTVVQIMQVVKGDADKATKEVEAAIKSAKEAGKEKATPKHVTTKEIKNQSFGKFYKWAEEIADAIAGRKDVFKEKEEVLGKMLVAFENGKSASDFAEGFFVDKAKKVALNKAAASKKINKR